MKVLEKNRALMVCKGCNAGAHVKFDVEGEGTRLCPICMKLLGGVSK